eukprot:TRINITY_DN8603_c0_g2_i3.p1 TRINITY_DN8603_c0_g2~~TRINITY_DN8603_c0_g2_i3.p1  ORF type:complete len:223 (-),score=40.89 TRINITY_DN8603_c0_g2_i3:302-931(-)
MCIRDRYQRRVHGLLQIQKEIDSKISADTLLYSEFYKVYANYYYKRGEQEEFYLYALQYLAYIPPSSLSDEEKIQWSIKMGMAVLLGKKIYNISELIEKDILKSLTKTEYVWLYDLIQAFNVAHVKDVLQALEQYKDNIAAHPNIKANLDNLVIKIKILALLDLVFYQAEGRQKSHFQHSLESHGMQRRRCRMACDEGHELGTSERRDR